MSAGWIGRGITAAATLCMAAGSTFALAQASSPDTGPPAAATSAANGASGASESTASLSRADREFLRRAARGDFAEIETGRLAQQQARGDSVKSFAARMVKDHSDVNDKLMTLAQNLSVTLPTAPSKADARQMEKLKGLTGRAFDHAYAREMVQDHRIDIREYEREAKHGKNSDVRDFAQSTLPVLREHLSLAEQLPGERTTASAASSTPAQR